ncbi:NADPH:quinone reductase [Breznakia pachnodae]|uniref:NADPH2:quinone reductase n=1 Tax=Breznakia pachnodae TaxID=265178 RepID=A0ABU0E0N9_9FIRM|nr:NADPH:quinone reductase [Breznakia pachnodae]MDQ0360293.1 NADPH2:quinone reductase [Breznakia pachnodae]
MKAIIVESFGDENVLQYKEIETPQPKANQVRVKIAAVGVNPVETYIRSGNYTRLPQLPYTPGNDGAGVVDEVGENVTRLKKGDRVYIAAILTEGNTGTYAEYVVVDEQAVHLLPDSLSFEQGASIGTPGLAAAYALFNRAQLKAGEKVLIHGASGGVGTIAVQLARQNGAIVYGTAGNEEGMKLAKELGAHYVYNHHDEDYLSKIQKDSQGIDAIIEMAAHQNLAKDTSILNPFGKIVVIGSRGALEFDPRTLMSKNLQVLGMNLINMKDEDYTSLLYKLTASFENGLRTVIETTMPLSDAKKAHELIISKDSKKGKIILTI